MPDKHLYLVDGHALAYRAYFAMIRNPLTNSKGRPTSAVFGMANYLIRLIKEYDCPYLAVAFDSPTPSFRKDIYEEYKANRVEMPDDLKSQIPLLFKLVECLNIPFLRQDGLEADDILATLTKRAQRAGYNVSLVTKDKDLMQLVSDNVRMLVPESGGKLIGMGPAQVTAKMGVPPEKILDLLTLMGDSSDNIPGVPGVGPKTAVKILEQAGSVAQLLADPQKAGTAKLAAKIKDNIDKIELSQKLVRLMENADIDLEIEALAARGPNRSACAEFFAEMEFQSFLNDPMFDTNVKTEFTVKTVETIEELTHICTRASESKILSIDTETTSTEPRTARLVGISMAVDGSSAWYVPVAHDETDKNLPLDDVLATLRDVLASTDVKKVGQNLKYDYQVFKNHGVVLGGLHFDAMIAAYLLEPGKRQYGMDALASQWLSINTVSIKELIGKGKDQKPFSSVLVEQAAHYSGEDAVIPLKLMNVLTPLLEERNLRDLFANIEMPLVTVLAEMEWEGILVDRGFLKDMAEEHSRELEKISQEIFKLAGEEFNLNSPKQISEVFFNKQGMPKSRKTKTGLSTNVDALEKLAPDYPIAAKLLDYRELQKLLSTYIEALPQQVNEETGRLHTSLNQTIAATGRLSSTGPNLQNIPVRTETGRRIREAFIAKKRFALVSADYSQIELRILAHMANDRLLIQAFKEDKDIHAQTAAAIHGIFPEMVTDDMRRAAKTINFGLMYGMGPINLSRQLNISFKEAREFIDIYFQQFPTVRTFMDNCIQKARDLGYSETLLGRRRYLPEINASNRNVREGAERTAINTPVQGSAADIIKIAMINIQKEISKEYRDARMLLQVHDELVFEVPMDEVERFKGWVQGLMSAACELAVPLKVDVGSGDNWRQAH